MSGQGSKFKNLYNTPSMFVMRLTWLDFIRRKDLYVVGIFMALFVLATMTIRIIGIGSESTATFLMSAGLTLSHVLAALVAVSFAARCFPEEFERGTMAPLLAKPLNRFDILLGKILACAGLAVGSYLLFVTVTLIAVPMVPGQRLVSLLQVLSLQAGGVVLLVTLAVTLSLYFPSVVSALACLAWYSCSGIVLNVIRDSVSVKQPALLPLVERLMALAPDAGLLVHTECFVNHCGIISNILYIQLMLYVFAWSALFFIWANWRFSRMRP